MWINEFELPQAAPPTGKVVPAGTTDVGPVPPNAQEWRVRGQMLRSLAAVFVDEPTTELLAALRTPGWLAAVQATGLSFGDDFLCPDLNTLAQDLAVEYTSLFTCSGGFPPVESVRLTGRYHQTPETEVAAVYRRWGYVTGRSRFSLFADHLGVELSFVAELMARGADCLDAQDQAGFSAIEKEIKRFWTLHLGRWARGYGQLLQRASSHSFYRVMGGLLNGFAEEELLALGLHKVEDLDQGRLEVPKSDIQVEFDPNEPVCNACGDESPQLTPPKPGARVVPLRAVSDLDF
ncbi:MAG: hypothetical protein OHK0048_00690 [Rhodoferax sp.]